MKTIDSTRPSGQAILEFVLILPFLIMFTLGIFDLGRAIWYYNTLAEAAREGSRYAMVHGSSSGSPVGPGSPSFAAPDSDSVVTSIVRRYGFGMDTGQIAVLAIWLDGDNMVGHRVNVEARYNYVPLASMIVGGVPVPLHSTSVSTIIY